MTPSLRRFREGLRLWRYARMIQRSGLLEREFYLAQCGEDPSASRDPVRHYLRYGAARGLNPNRFFDTAAYVTRHPVAGAQGKNPLIHFIRYGVRKGLDPGPGFSTALYLFCHPEVRASGLNPLAHHLAKGRDAGPFTFESPQAALALLDAPGLKLEARNRVLVVDHRLPTPDQDSGSVRMSAIITLLAELGHQVTFVSDSTERMPDYQERLRPVAPLQLFGPLEALEHLQAEGGSYRYALLSRPEQASRYLPLVRGLAVHATAAYDTVDLHWVRLARAAEVTGDPALLGEAERFRTLELASAAGADLVLAITAQEQATLRAEVPGARVAVVPNIHAAGASVAPLAGRRDLFFIGGFEHQPNVDAVQWFVSEILPAVRRELPEAVFRVVGSRPTDEVKRLGSPSVQVAGFVADPEPFFAGCRVFVSPLRYGAGMKGKVGQAMAFGLPVVTTSVGAEGMRLLDGETALVADDPASFAAAVVRLYGDDQLWQRLSESGRSHIERHFSRQAVRGLLSELFPLIADPIASDRT